MLFTPDELKSFQMLPPDEKQEAFISSWTRKEAMLKASGDGLTKAMNELEVSFMRDNPFQMKKKDGRFGYQTDWFLESRALMGNYFVSVAAKGAVHSTNYFSLEESGMLFQ